MSRIQAMLLCVAGVMVGASGLWLAIDPGHNPDQVRTNTYRTLTQKFDLAQSELNSWSQKEAAKCKSGKLTINQKALVVCVEEGK